MQVCSFFFHNLNQRNVIKLIFFSTGLKIFKLNFVSCTCTLNLTVCLVQFQAMILSYQVNKVFMREKMSSVISNLFITKTEKL